MLESRARVPCAGDRPLPGAALVCVTALLTAGCGSSAVGPFGPSPGHGEATSALRTLGGESGLIRSASPAAFRRELAMLRGYPVVINQWASWCGPCRFEFPSFQHLARRYRGDVAFLGVDSKDSASDAQRFLKQLPVPYPSYYDPAAAIARVFDGGQYRPTTVFFNRTGRLTYVHQGAYATERALGADIVRFALRG